MTSSVTKVFLAQLKKDSYLALYQRREWLSPLVFLLLVQSLFPLALGADMKLLQQAAPAILWVSALLASFISIDSLFQDDADDGCLEQMLVAKPAFYVFCVAKLFKHWLVSGLPLVIVSPLLAMSFAIGNDALWVVFLSLLLATPSLCCISALASALTLNARKGGVLLSLVILPLYLPILIFGSGAILQSVAGDSAKGGLLMLAAIMTFVVSIAPFALGSILKFGIADS